MNLAHKSEKPAAYSCLIVLWRMKRITMDM